MILVIAFASAAVAAETPVIGGPCQGCELALIGMPEDLASSSRIAPEGEPGESMIVEGIVRDADGSPVAGVIVYAYQTSEAGLYPKAATRHGALRGWVRSDAEGRYRFLTIRPGAYPSRDIPEHIHMHVIEAGKGTYYIDDITFSDDPLLTAARRAQSRSERGGSGESTPQRDDQGTWRVHRDIILGMDIPGYSH
jgi:protocatechuate 3,4-dioxygenase beta subunit